MPRKLALGTVGVEPTTSCLKGRSSTVELHPLKSKEDGHFLCGTTLGRLRFERSSSVLQTDVLTIITIGPIFQKAGNERIRTSTTRDTTSHAAITIRPHFSETVRAEGIEPSFADRKSAVLPLHHALILVFTINYH